MLKKYALIFLSISLTSCASYFLRRNCEKTNWFEYGEKLALTGKRVNEDGFVQECRKADADIAESLLDKGFKKGRDSYCKPSGAFLTGKRGEFINLEMCSGLNLSKLKEEHVKGVREYCQVENGFSVGATGKDYNNICPKELEVEFLKQFNKGRKKFFAATIAAKEQDIQAANENIENARRRRDRIDFELKALIIVNVSSSDKNLELQKRRETLQSESQEQDRQIQREESRIQQLRNDIQSMRIKMESLDADSP